MTAMTMTATESSLSDTVLDLTAAFSVGLGQYFSSEPSPQSSTALQ